MALEDKISIQEERKTTPNLWDKASIAIPLTYITVGLLISFPSAYIQYYPRQLGASDSQLSTIQVVRALPWSFKIFYGILPDTLPVFGYRFKPHMLTGYFIACAFNFALFWIKTPDVVEFTLCLLGANVGVIMADVMGDTLVVTLARKESFSDRGQVQSTVYMCRFLAEVVGYWAGSIFCNPDTWGWGLSLHQTFLLVAFLPFVSAIPALIVFREQKVDSVPPIRIQLKGLWKMVQLRAVWQPLSFIVLYNALNTYNAAWGNYLQVAFHFNAFQYGSMSAVGATVAFFGVYVYRKYCLHANNWRLVYTSTTFVIVVFGILNIALIFRVHETLGIPAYWFAMGDNAMLYFAYGMQYMPSAIMFASVCPENQEAVAFAMLTGFQNLGAGIASTFSNLMLGIWPVQLEDLKAGHMDGVWKLTILSKCINLLPLLFMRYLLPSGLDQVERLKHTSSRTGGLATITTWIIAFFWVVSVSLLAVIEPCHILVGGNGCAHH